MRSRNFHERLRKKQAEGKHLCIGLDPDFSRVPLFLRNEHAVDPEGIIFEFNCAIIDKTKDIAAAYKLNSAFYEARKAAGWRALARTIDYIHSADYDAVVIDDAKRGDNENTNGAYEEAILDSLGADAITVSPYMGGVSLANFRARKEECTFVICRTSNEGAEEFQELRLAKNGMMLYEYVAHQVATEWNEHGNCGLVVGANFPEAIRRIRAIAPETLLLLPGAGEQGADIAEAVPLAKTESGGFLINSSRQIIFASDAQDFAAAAREEALMLDEKIRQHV